MIKSKIQCGYGICLRNGEEYLAMADSAGNVGLSPVCAGNKRTLWLQNYDDMFCHYNNKDLDIVIIYDNPEINLANALDCDFEKYRDILWRENYKIPEYTHKELADLIGHEFKLKVEK